MVDLSSNTVTTRAGWIVLQRLQHHDGRQFTTPAIFDTKQNADIFASCFDNVVAIMPIEWEE